MGATAIVRAALVSELPPVAGKTAAGAGEVEVAVIARISPVRRSGEASRNRPSEPTRSRCDRLPAGGAGARELEQNRLPAGRRRRGAVDLDHASVGELVGADIDLDRALGVGLAGRESDRRRRGREHQCTGGHAGGPGIAQGALRPHREDLL